MKSINGSGDLVLTCDTCHRDSTFHGMSYEQALGLGGRGTDPQHHRTHPDDPVLFTCRDCVCAEGRPVDDVDFLYDPLEHRQVSNMFDLPTENDDLYEDMFNLSAASEDKGEGLDHCPVCGGRILNFDPDGFEGDSGQRGHRSEIPDWETKYASRERSESVYVEHDVSVEW